MQGNLSEIDVRSLLQLVEMNQRTGELFIETGEGRYFSLFFEKGRILYATSSDGAVERLKQCASRFAVGDEAFSTPPHPAPASAPEYGLLSAMVEAKSLSTAQAATLIKASVEEILFEVLGLGSGPFIFEAAGGLGSHFVSLAALETGTLLTATEKRLQEWQKLAPTIESIEQRPVIVHPDKLAGALPAPVWSQLQQWMTGQNSLRLLARVLGRDPVTVSRAIVPYLQQGWMRLESDPPRQVRSSAPVAGRACRVACVDDSIAIQKSVEYFLQGRGYEVKTIANPLKALGELFSFKPDLILLDIAMPRLDGYELCGMLRKSNVFSRTPVIMLTGKDGHVDRVRARMAGATEYLTKPFGERELLDLVDKYLASTGERLLSTPRN